MKDKTFLALSGLFFLIFFIGIASVALESPMSRTIRAQTAIPSSSRSFATVFPQVGQAGDEEAGETPTKIKVSIIIRDTKGDLLPNRTVKISTDSEGTVITPSDTQNTNEIGLAVFYISSKVPQTVRLTATDSVSNTQVLNIPSIEFTR